MPAWREAAGIYRDPRVLSMLFIGFSSGVPFGVLAEPLSAWLTDSGVSKTGIGLFALVSLPYTLKFLFAPFMDRLPLGRLTRMFGRRRSWALLAQAALLALIPVMGMTAPGIDPLWTGVFGLAVAFSSAAQDVVLDAYRVEILEERKLAAGAATFVFGWRIGQVGAGAAGLILADILPWPTVFWGMGALVLVGVAAMLINPEPRVQMTPESEALQRQAEAFLERRRSLPPSLAEALAWVYAAAVCPLIEFVQRRGAQATVAILAFILLYKFGDAVLGVMKVPFFLEIGFSKTQIAEIAKVFGVFAIIGGGLLGGLVVARLGIMAALLVCGVLMAASNLIFVMQAWVGPEMWMLAVTIAVENITTGMGTTAFVAYLSSLCNVAYTATQYALLTSLMGFSRTVMSSGAGWLADQMAWPVFFLLTTLAAIPGLVLLVWMWRRFPARPAAAQAESAG